MNTPYNKLVNFLTSIGFIRHDPFEHKSLFGMLELSNDKVAVVVDIDHEKCFVVDCNGTEISSENLLNPDFAELIVSKQIKKASILSCPEDERHSLWVDSPDYCYHLN